MQYWEFGTRQLRCIASASQTLSLAAAAKAVGITPSGVGQAIGQLEDQLRHVLFDRQGDRLSLTASACLLVPRVEAALERLGDTRITMAQVRTLLALAETGSFADASSAIGVPQPLLRRDAKQLSHVLRLVLIEGSGDRRVMTMAGQHQIREFRLLRAELSAALAELAWAQNPATGHLVIGAASNASARLLSQATGAFQRLHPQVTLRISGGSRRSLTEALRDGELDILIGPLRQATVADDMTQRPIYNDCSIILGRRGHPLTLSDGPPTVAALAQFPWILPSATTPLRRQWEQMFVDAGMVVPMVPVECASVGIIRQMLLDSDSLTLLPHDEVAFELEVGSLVRVAEGPTNLTRTIGVTTRRFWRPTPPQRAFVGILDAIEAGSTGATLLAG